MRNLTHNTSHSAKAPPPGRPTVLVADDNYASRIVAKAILERENCSIVLAENGRVALELSRLQPFDLILMDIQMPILDGLTAARLIKSGNSPNKNTPIFAVTAYANSAMHKAVMSAGMSDMLTKPLRAEQIKSLWSRAISAAEPQERAALAHCVNAGSFARIEQLDVMTINALVEAASPATLAHLYQRFFDSANAFVDEIHAHQAGAQRKEAEPLAHLRKNAHALKGACANVGIKRVSRIAGALQNAAPSEILDLTQNLRALMASAQTEIEQHLQSLFTQASKRAACQ